GNTQWVLGHHRQAQKAYQESVAILEKLLAEFPSEPTYRAALADSYHQLGSLQKWRLDEPSERTFRRSLALREKLAAEFPQVPDYQARLAVTLQGLSGADSSMPDADEGLRRAVVIADRLATEFPSVSRYRALQTDWYFWLGNMLDWHM